MRILTLIDAKHRFYGVTSVFHSALINSLPVVPVKEPEKDAGYHFSLRCFFGVTLAELSPLIE